MRSQYTKTKNDNVGINFGDTSALINLYLVILPPVPGNGNAMLVYSGQKPFSPPCKEMPDVCVGLDDHLDF